MGRIRTGRTTVRPHTPSHIKGVKSGNPKKHYLKQAGHHPDGTADARRSTGVNPKKHNAVLKIMPNLPPG